jgi:toxin ParE1/3/4
MGTGKSRTAKAVNLPVIWSDEARAEFYDAVRWYGDLSSQLSERFIDAVEKAAQPIEQHPLRFPTVYRDRRRAPVPHFPYGLYYQIEAERIFLIACFHGKRNPRQWQRR